MVDWSFASADIMSFCTKLVRRAKKGGIPLRVDSASFEVCFVVHGRKGRYLSRHEWALIAHIGREISQQYGLPIRWGGFLMPSCWMANGQGPSVPF